jgi:hypothetical protein
MAAGFVLALGKLRAVSGEGLSLMRRSLTRFGDAAMPATAGVQAVVNRHQPPHSKTFMVMAVTTAKPGTADNGVIRGTQP